MKPIIIFKEKNKNGKYEFTEEEFKALIENAFDEGYEEGKKTNIPIYPITYPSPCGTGDKFWLDRQILCEQNPKPSNELTSVTSKPNPNVTLRG